ncbi:hypothetical protein FKW77_005245 [Venturia effusa]|uniref:chitinase n=1 Tax=Venturia effusa TaxID=50376 RepID=A0A517LKE4_9PEZI|nr:hypothetical protein FKW77_005245 [Venturia effusa]
MLPSLKFASILLAATVVQAQTTTECDPLLKTCPNDAAIPAKLTASFSEGIPKGWRRTICKGPLTFSPEGASIGYKEAEDCTSVETIGTALFGNFEVKLKAAPGKGIVSSIVLQSDVRDEIDWEFLGGEDYRVQSNYFGKGDTTTYDRMIYIPTPNNQASYHTYGINWTSASITWTLDGAPVRTLNYADAKGGSRFPQTPARLKIGIWAAPTDKPGIIEWAGGLVDMSKAPFAMILKEVDIVNYSPAKEYRYKDHSGNWESIELIPGVPDDDEEGEDSTIPAKTPGKPTPAPTMGGEGNSSSSSSATTPSSPDFTNGATLGNSSSSATKTGNATATGSKPSSSKSTSAGAVTVQFGGMSAACVEFFLLFWAFFG